ncbi:MAG: PHP domain-containing protein [Candidatus Woesearchaeota archaeon]
MKNEGYVCVDMHLHSEYSADSNSKIDGIIEKAKSLGIGVAITDHNCIEGSLKAIDNEKNVLVIPGIEVCSKEGIDVLFYFKKKEELIGFYNEVIAPNRKKNRHRTSKLKINVLIENGKRYNSVICLAHPYRNYTKKIINILLKKRLIKKIFDMIPLYEVINSKNFNAKNKKAIKVAKKKHKNVLGGSDAHNTKDIGRTLTCVKTKEDAASFLNGIKENNTLVIGNLQNLKTKLIFPLYMFYKTKIKKIKVNK